MIPLDFIARHCDFSAIVSFLSAFPTLMVAGVLLAVCFWVVGNVIRLLLDVMRAG